ncbi:LacI family transcriptional regulator [Solitalea longa]|uniref:LacI family transcriptional regulator n=1 Tax=Solitalea longa TaxID=2079460 RepID=A0A2S5A2D9_9SPHI|nr:LacI family DNA-binding transcriptional regulator [Solitalea longa]POY36741.1 LacI family transcriptional regulator [Solitalea longa]
MQRDKLPTIKEIAKRLKVSTSTVSRALHNHPSIGYITTYRVHKLAEELGYEPNLTAISFKQRKTYTIGVVLPNLSEAFFSTAISGIEDFAATKNYNVLLGQSLDDPEREKRIIETMKTHRVDGMIVSITKNTDNYDHFDQLTKYHIPIVFFDRIPEKKDISYVACNLESGLLQALNLLIEQGHRKIGLINGPDQLIASNQRKETYLKGLTDNNIKPDEKLMVSSSLSKESNQQATSSLLELKDRPTAIITFNDYVALDAIAIAKKHGLVINKDVSIISFANLPIWEYMDNRPLASIEQFPYRQGEKASEILFSFIESQSSTDESTEPLSNQQIIFDSELIKHL